HDEDAHGPSRRDQWFGEAVGTADRPPGHAHAAARRLHVAGLLSIRGADRSAEPPDACAALSHGGAKGIAGGPLLPPRLRVAALCRCHACISAARNQAAPATGRRLPT